MKLGEFIEKFSPNNLVRLVYNCQGGHEIVLTDWNDVSMGWQILKREGLNRHYIDNEVLGLASILITKCHYPEAINIVIERLENQPFIEEAIAQNYMTEKKFSDGRYIKEKINKLDMLYSMTKNKYVLDVHKLGEDLYIITDSNISELNVSHLYYPELSKLIADYCEKEIAELRKQFDEL